MRMARGHLTGTMRKLATGKRGRFDYKGPQRSVKIIYRPSRAHRMSGVRAEFSHESVKVTDTFSCHSVSLSGARAWGVTAARTRERERADTEGFREYERQPEMHTRVSRVQGGRLLALDQRGYKQGAGERKYGRTDHV